MAVISKNLPRIKIAALFISLLIIDQFTKKTFQNYYYSNIFIEIKTVLNRGFILGILSNYDPILKSSFVLLLSLLISFVMLAFLFFNKPKNTSMNYSFTFILSGIWGNTIDKIQEGFVIDFLTLKFFTYKTSTFNLADIYIALGITTLLIFLYLNGLCYPKDRKRKRLIVFHNFQKSFIIKCLLINFFSSLTIILFSSLFLIIVSKNSHFDGNSILLLSDYIIMYFIFIFLLVLILQGISFIYLLFYSNRIAGPVYSFINFIKKLNSGVNNLRKVTLRDNDEFKELESVSIKLLATKSKK